LRSKLLLTAFLSSFLLAPVVEAVPFEFGGGGTPATDCLATFVGEPNRPATAPRDVRCADGEACDADGVVNGECQIPIAACVNSTYNPSRCTLSGVGSVVVAHALDNGDPKFDPEFQAFQTRINGLGIPNSDPDQCSLPTNFRVKVKGPFQRNFCRRGTKFLKVVTSSVPILGRVYRETDVMRLECLPSPTFGCDPQVFYQSTFDRVQRQVFNQSCAVSGCHDSQSQMSGLLLEEGAALGDLVDVTPLNAAAAAMGWKRILPGSSDASFLFHKVKGTLPNASFGQRMPRGRPRLNSSLVLVIEKWIDAGAPETGWVPGTF
jgi:hypothetical protein